MSASVLVPICFLVLMAISARAETDTSYTPPPASGGPYPASGVAASDAAGTSSAKAPYPAPGWKPSARILVLPVIRPTPAAPPTKKCVTPGKTTTESEFVTEESTATSPKPEVGRFQYYAQSFFRSNILREDAAYWDSLVACEMDAVRTISFFLNFQNKNCITRAHSTTTRNNIL